MWLVPGQFFLVADIVADPAAHDSALRFVTD
jgi:hypothetical protein